MMSFRVPGSMFRVRVQGQVQVRFLFRFRFLFLFLFWFVGGAGAAERVRVTTDVDYVPQATYANNKDRLDVYAPEHASKAPVVVSIHGGSLEEGDKRYETGIGERLASAGLVVVVINYRLSPGVMHPAHVQDAAAAVAWAKRHIGEYGGDPNKVFVIGHSAGAYLVALLALDARYLAVHQLTPKDVRGFVPVSGFFYVDRRGVAPDRPKYVWGRDPQVWTAASPATYVRADVPPMLLLYADGDEPWRRQQQRDLAADLRRAGMRNIETRVIGGRTHSSIWYDMADRPEETLAAITQFVQKVLKDDLISAPPTN
jgi:acetyl esterase/lipase